MASRLAASCRDRTGRCRLSRSASATRRYGQQDHVAVIDNALANSGAPCACGQGVHRREESCQSFRPCAGPGVPTPPQRGAASGLPEAVEAHHAFWTLADGRPSSIGDPAGGQVGGPAVRRGPVTARLAERGTAGFATRRGPVATCRSEGGTAGFATRRGPVATCGAGRGAAGFAARRGPVAARHAGRGAAGFGARRGPVAAPGGGDDPTGGNID